MTTDETTPRKSDPVAADAEARVEAPPASEVRRRAVSSRPLPDDAVPIVPVRNVVLFPGTVIPLTVCVPRLVTIPSM